jgi:hypothetical protein
MTREQQGPENPELQRLGIRSERIELTARAQETLARSRELLIKADEALARKLTALFCGPFVFALNSHLVTSAWSPLSGAKQTSRGQCLARSNAAQWGTRIRRRNRKCYAAAVAIVRSVAAAIRALVT